ncbi:MAG TPA: DUF1761 domain-containing protein [Candidatus Saccharimonadales bacterium]|nr:DUF1761 domain-containing protein [Candidatus Saccharimonadales bacterium]
MPHVDINWMVVVVAAIVNMVVGAAWYSGALFGKQWSQLTGRKLEDMRKNAGPGYAVTAVGALVQAWILVHFVAYAQATTAVKGAVVGFMLWLGFVAITQGVNTVFAGTRKKLWAINTGYFLVVLVINGALLAAWK